MREDALPAGRRTAGGASFASSNRGSLGVGCTALERASRSAAFADVRTFPTRSITLRGGALRTPSPFAARPDDGP